MSITQLAVQQQNFAQSRIDTIPAHSLSLFLSLFYRNRLVAAATHM